MKINKFIIVILVVFISGFIGGVFAGSKDKSCDKMVDIMDLPQNIDNVRDLTQKFCDKVYDSKCTHDGDVFDANQSIFLSLLCDNVGEGEKFVSINRLSKDEGGILLKTGFDQFGIYDNSFLDDSDTSDIDFCDYRENDMKNNMNGCNYAEHLPKMFDEIMNDFFNIKQADLYGIDQIDDSITSEMAANKFANTHFPGFNENGTYYPGLCDPTSKYYGDTCKYLKNYMKNVKNLLKETKVIDVESLIEVNLKEKTDCQNNFGDNILYCGLLGDNIVPEASFIDVVYNEYLWYRLFVSYYSYELSVEPKFSELMVGDRIEKMNRNREKIYSFQEQILRSRQAVSAALRSLSEISSSFPLHVGFLMYQEDARLFMKRLSKLYPPIMTLFDKLRNVQKAE